LRAKQASVLNGTGKELRFLCRLKAFIAPPPTKSKTIDGGNLILKLWTWDH
jgi:hypothetical protein